MKLQFEPLGEAALLVRGLPTGAAEAWARSGGCLQVPGIREAWAAFGVLALETDPYGCDEAKLRDLLGQEPPDNREAWRTWKLALKLDGPDLDAVCQELGLTPSRLAESLGAAPLEVEAIGFCPGFSYLGPLPRRLWGMKRLDSPRAKVEPGSVGIVGDQACIYTLARPGGWPLIGRIDPAFAARMALEPMIEAGDRIWLKPAGASI
jgi:allophanate hydrolase subunit 1